MASIAAHEDMVKDRDERRSWSSAMHGRSARRLLCRSAKRCLPGLGVDMREFERVMLLSAVDHRWMDHIDAMDQLRDGIGLSRLWPNATPWWNTRLNAAHMFDELIHLIREDTVRRIVSGAGGAHARACAAGEAGGGAFGGGSAPSAPEGSLPTKKVGRNRALPLRQRQEVQELLRTERPGGLKRFRAGKVRLARPRTQL